MTEDDDDVLMMSLTDALTCVLAASIALFLVFVAFVKLIPADAHGGTLSSSKLMSRAVSEDLKAGFSTAVVRIQSNNCREIEGLSLSLTDIDDWIMRDVDGVGCVRIFGLRDGVSDPIYVFSDSSPHHPLNAFLEVGAAYWPPNGLQTISENGFRPCTNGKFNFVLFQISNRRDDYFSYRTEGAC